MDKGLYLTFAIPDHPWIDAVECAAVRIAMSVGASSLPPPEAKLQQVIAETPHEETGENEVQLDLALGKISADFTAGANVAATQPLKANDGLKRYPKYKHVAVIVAEDITSRFLNVISLFNASIPLVAIQMSAYKSGDDLGLVFTKVLDQTAFDAGDDEEEVLESTDRSYWENERGTKATVSVADDMLKLVKECDPSLELKYNKFYIGLARSGQANNFVIFRPRKEALRFEPRLPQTPETEKRLTDAGLDVMDYDSTWNRYRIRLQAGDVEKHRTILKQVVQEAYDAAK